MVKYETLLGAGDSANNLIKQLPSSIQAIFGLTGFDLMKVSGYFGVMFMYIALMATIHAVLLGADIISKEERDRTSEFLFVKPILRSKIISLKIMAGLVCLVIFNILTAASSVYFVNLYGKDTSITVDIVNLMVGLFFMQLIFFFIGTAVASVIKKAKISSSIATAVLLMAFILTFFINMNQDLDNLKYFTPFKYFDAKDILANGSLDIFYVILSSFIVLAMIGLTYRVYSKRDLSV